MILFTRFSESLGIRRLGETLRVDESLRKEFFMSRQAETQQPSPALFFETMNAYQRTACLKGAIELNLFTAIAEGADTAETLARRCGASERGVRILCDYLVIIGFLTKDGN